MKKIIVFVLIFTLMILNYFDAKKTMFHALNDNRLNYEILSENCNSFLIKIDACDLSKFMSIFSIQNLSKKHVAGRIIFEGYLKCIDNCLNIGNKKINLQISLFDGEVLIGSPLINNSF